MLPRADKNTLSILSSASCINPQGQGAGRRLSCILAAAAGILALDAVQPSSGFAQGGIQRIYNSAHPPLPAMGPSLRSTVRLASAEPPGTIIIRKDERVLFLVTGKGEALRYQISVGREGFGWTGQVTVGSKKEWPDWRPPSDMRKRQPDLPEFVPAGPYNPLGARALYLHRQGRDTLYRIHGTNDPAGVGFDGTSGCFRLTNTDIIDLFNRVALGAKVIVQ